MSRGVGEVEYVQELLPEWFAVVAALLTQLGDVWFLATLLVVLYWLDLPDQDDVATLAGVWLAGMGCYKGFKEVFAFPRPDDPLLETELLPWVIQPLYEATAFATGYGFPSGHAVNATIVYVGLAAIANRGPRRLRYGVAVAVVATVSFTRVALGVHYLVDVVVGVAVGATLLYAAASVTRRLPTDMASVTFAAAVGFGAFFVATSGAHSDAVVLLAVSLGAFAGWQLVELGRTLAVLDRPSRALRPVALRGVAVAVAVAPLVAALELFPLLSAYAASGAVGLVTVGLVVLPVLRYSRRVRRPFRDRRE